MAGLIGLYFWQAKQARLVKITAPTAAAAAAMTRVVVLNPSIDGEGVGVGGGVGGV